MTGKIITALIIIILGVCCYFIIRKKIKDIKKGKFCSCHNCSDCCSCNSKKNTDNSK